MNIFLVGLISGAAVVGSCGSNSTVDATDVNEQKIYGHYSARYDADAEKVEFFTQFRLGGVTGTTIRLTEPAKVSVEEQGMQLHDGANNTVNFIGTYYTFEQSVASPNTEYTFAWTRTDGAAFENTVAMAKPFVVSSPAAQSTYRKQSGDLVMTFDGDDVRSDEHAIFYIQSDRTPTDGEVTVRSHMIFSGHEGAVPKADMATFVNGPAYLYVVRERSQSTQEGHAVGGGKMDAEFVSKRVAVTVAD